MYKIISAALLLSALFACQKDDTGDIPFDPETGWFPQIPENISGLNTRFDEYNSHISGKGLDIEMYYASNFETQGKDFNLQGTMLLLDINEGQRVMALSTSSQKPSLTSRLLPLITSDFEERGPLAFQSGTTRYFFYAHNKAGQYEIEYCYQQGSQANIEGPFNASVLNSKVCDFYPAINREQTQMVFSSYRSGKYDIYEIDIEGNDFMEWLDKGTNSALLITSVSSAKDDKCPCINGNLMVFASNREGGYGAYDLWYSEFKDNKWGDPVNFGPEINSEYDEFSPSTLHYPDSNNDLMIFSSNRPGGKGGYDFYFVGIQKMME